MKKFVSARFFYIKFKKVIVEVVVGYAPCENECERVKRVFRDDTNNVVECIL